MKLGESLEDYLETLLILEETGKIRCVDVASRMHVSKPSVNKAMNVLKEKGYVLQESYGDIHLTDAGRDLAKSIYLRHETISGFLQDVLGVSAENVISEETFQKLMDFKNKYAK